MKILLFIAICFAALAGDAQNLVTAGVRVGVSPTVHPHTNYLIVNRSEPGHELLFDVEYVTFSPQAGLMVRSEGKHFWFMGEALFSHQTSTYSVVPIRDMNGAEPQSPGDSNMYNEKVSYVDIPLSVGVKLGRFEVFSGFFASFEFMRSSELDDHPKFTRTSDLNKFGWHSGVGLNFHNIIFDVRYQQQFGNYGQGVFVEGKELLLKNAPGRFTASVAFRF